MLRVVVVAGSSTRATSGAGGAGRLRDEDVSKVLICYALCGHCQLNGKSLIAPFLVSKPDGLQVAKIKEGVKEENDA